MNKAVQAADGIQPWSKPGGGSYSDYVKPVHVADGTHASMSLLDTLVESGNITADMMRLKLSQLENK